MVTLVLLLVEWGFFLLVALCALGSVGVLATSFGLAIVAGYRRVGEGAWPSWTGRLGAAAAIAATIALPIGAWIGYLAVQ